MKNLVQFMLEGMCEWSESYDENLSYTKKCMGYSVDDAVSFKPGLGDRLLFKKLVEGDIKSIDSEASSRDPQFQMVWAARYMEIVYYHQYGWYDKIRLEEALRQ